jgi:hypothetical protein
MSGDGAQPGMPRRLDGWRSTQGRAPDGAIDSEQQLRATRPAVERSEQGAAALGRAYWREVTRASRGVVRAREDARGVELRLLAFGPTLLRFGPAELRVGAEGVGAAYPIRGGLLARSPGGTLSVSQSDGDAPVLSAAVRGFHPRLAARQGRPPFTDALYEHVQRRVHVAISRRYLWRLTVEGAR